MTAVTQTRPATYADIEALPPHVVGEILFGVLHTRPHVWARLSAAPSTLALAVPAAGSSWTSLSCIWGPHVIVPDIAGWRRERMPKLPETAYFETAPDWVCEVLSPSTARIDHTDKLAICAAHGVGHCWLVDPDARTLEVLALTGAKWLLAATFKDADPVTAPPFDVHTFALDVLWPE